MVALLLLQLPMVHAAEEFLEFDIDGQTRRVLLFVPDAPGTGPRNLVVVFHGRGDDDRAFANAVRLHTDWPDAIVAYPRGEIRESTKMRGWQYRVGDQGDRDLALTDRLLEETARRFGTQPDNTHVAGFSNGGHFVLLLLAERPDAFATFTVIGSVKPDFQSDAPPRPVLYLFGRGEDRQYKDDWAGTVEALVRHNRTSGPLTKFMGCCQLQSPGAGGAPFVFGLYGAGHIWPSQGNEWLMAFTRQAWSPTGNPAPPRAGQ
jgi:poly(3-hydroxybutyrate) depolymerase